MDNQTFTPVEPISTQPAPIAPEPMATPPAAAPAPTDKKKISPAIIVTIIVVALAILGTAAFFIIWGITSNNNSSNNNQAQQTEQPQDTPDDPTNTNNSGKEDIKNKPQISKDKEDGDKRQERINEGKNPKPVSITYNGKSFQISRDYIQSAKNMLSLGYKLEYRTDKDYSKYTTLTDSGIDAFKKTQLGYLTELYLVDKLPSDNWEGRIFLIAGRNRDLNYAKDTTVENVIFDQFFSSKKNAVITLPNGKSVTITKTPAAEIRKAFGVKPTIDVSQLISFYDYGGWDYSFTLDKTETQEVESITIKLPLAN